MERDEQPAGCALLSCVIFSQDILRVPDCLGVQMTDLYQRVPLSLEQPDFFFPVTHSHIMQTREGMSVKLFNLLQSRVTFNLCVTGCVTRRPENKTHCLCLVLLLTWNTFQVVI